MSEAKQVQLRRGTTSEHSSFKGAVGEVTVDTSKNTLVVHDGVTSGGHPVTFDIVSQSEAEAGTATTRRTWTAQRVRQAATAMFNAATTVFTRTLLGRTNAAQVRGDLELGTAATRSVTTSNTDTTANRLLKVGDFGIGAQNLAQITIPLSVGEANNFCRRVLGNSSEAHGLPTGTFAMSTFATTSANTFAVFYPMNVTQDIYAGNLTINSGNESVKRFFKLLSEANTTIDKNGFLRSSGSANAVPETRNIIAGTGLSGGGNLSANRTLSVNYGTTAGTAAQGNDSRINNGQTAFGWGNHASAGYALKSYTDTELNKGLGVKQTWQNVSSVRFSGVTYTNSTGKPITVNLYTQGGGTVSYVDGGQIGPLVHGFGTSCTNVHSFIVPPGKPYSISFYGNFELKAWWELR